MSKYHTPKGSERLTALELDGLKFCLGWAEADMGELSSDEEGLPEGWRGKISAAFRAIRKVNRWGMQP